MKFEIIRHEDRFRKVKKGLDAAFLSNPALPGALVSYEMRALEHALPELLHATMTQAFREKCGRTYYHLATKDGLVQELIPMAHYTQHASEAIARKIYSLDRIAERAHLVAHRLRYTHNRTRELIARTGQPRIRAADEIYELTEELSAFLFFGRSILDHLASLLHIVAGRQFVSFADFGKYMLGGQGVGSDPAMEEYLARKMDWFAPLRDLRDWATHAGTIDITLYEEADGSLSTCINHVLPVDDFIDATLGGLKEYVAFFDSHFAAGIATSNAGTQAGYA